VPSGLKNEPGLVLKKELTSLSPDGTKPVIHAVGNSTNPMEVLGSTWKYLEVLGSTWKYLEALGSTWKHLEEL